MAEIVVAQRMWQRRDTAANWTSVNPVLAAGEIGVELGASSVSQQRVKVGNGVTPWNDLQYLVQVREAVDLGDVSGTVVCNWSKNREIRMRLTGNATLQFTDPSPGDSCILSIYSLSGLLTLSLPGNVSYSAGIPAYVVPQSTAVHDRIGLIYSTGPSRYDLVAIAKGLSNG